jgi:DNA mismatch repair protein MutS
MYPEYRAFYEKYREVYGDNTAIFLQVGSFYELYDSINPLSGESTCNCREIVDHLGIQLTIRKGDGETGHDGLFAGIPDHSLHKWAGRLTAAGWTVVVVDQVKDSAGRVQRREVARILSPGTHIEAATSDAGATIAAIWLEASACSPSGSLSYGAAVLDLTTGITHTTAGQTKGEMTSWTSDTLVQFLQIYSPRELLVLWRGDALLVPDEALLRRRLGMPTGLIHVRLAGPDYQGSLEVDMVREEFLRATYGIKSLLPTREWLRLGQGQGQGQERALVCLLRFVEDHFPSALTQLQLNRPWMPRSALTLGNHALTQLQIIAPRLQDSVLGLFRSCITPMGKRAMRERLLSPSADAAVIEARLAEVDQYVSCILQPEGKQDGVLSSLRSIYDLPRLHRRVACGTVSAADVLALDQSYRVAVMLGRADLPALLDAPQGLLDDLAAWRTAAFDKYISVEKAARASEDCSFLVASEAQFPRIATAEARLAEIRAIVERFAELCCTVTGRTTGFKVEEKEKQAYGIRGTKVALQSLQGHLRSAADVATVVESLRGATTVTSGANGGWVEVPWLAALSAEAARLRAQLAADVARELPQVCAALILGAPWTPLEEWLEKLDVTQCIARESVSRGYVRPQIISDAAAGEAASLDARGLRHPLIETILTRTEYVQHNVSIGTSPEARSWLVYGMNASGKSSLMKSIGIAVHLAQAGCYVPATSFAIAPFTSIYTRILNQDNLWAGLSSFAVEMAEMRDILDAADSRTLVLGDELCSGTESVSAQALVAAGIEWLSEAGARFVFATHLHGLLDVLPAPAQLGLQVWHLKVAYDAVKDRLVYERTLKPGAGSTLYGIEVARAMHLPVQFIEVAHRYRRRLQGAVSYEEATGSSWNSAVARRQCEVCGAGLVSDLEVHHIRPRAEAAAGALRFADGAGRDDVRNLIVVCAKCHDEAHAGRQEIGALVQTSDGPVRGGEVSEGSSASAASAETRASKWDPAEQGIILNMLRINQIVPLKIIAFRLKEEHDIDISEATLRRIRKSGSF